MYNLYFALSTPFVGPLAALPHLTFFFVLQILLNANLKEGPAGQMEIS